MPPDPAPTADPVRTARPHTLNVGDAPQGHSYIAIVERLALECAAPVAAIVHVEAERLWFRAAVGVLSREMPRQTAFGELAALGDGLSIVEDAATDPRFSVRPLTVAGRSMRFYAGAPLVLHGGDRIGVLCVLDCLPRRFTLADARHLRWLAKRTAILMNVQKAVEQVAFGRAG